ncbi:MAG: SDR family oxidoreductase [Thiotrichales bacterium]|nr:SDR family oxidoreductase [Thiotrichales bacterium]MBT6771934.1 SDR family oxidoreductase [Thiotrichales bacterium]
MKIIVTGAIGHIGSYIIRDLGVSFPGSNVVMVDNMMTQRFPSLFNLPSNSNYSFIEGDVSQIDLKPVFFGADVVIHLAAITDAAGSINKAEELEANNFQSTLRVAEACIEADASLIAISSTSVYGTQKDQVDENCSDSELQPQSPYATTKLKEEELIANLSKDKGLKAIHCRFGTIFGASQGMRFHTAVNKFCWQAVMNQPISVWTTAYDQKRPYLDLLDASRAIAFIIKNNIFDGQIYNVLTSNATVRQVVDTIKEFVPNLEIEFVDNQIMNQLSYEVLCQRFKSKGFVFSGNMRRGIKETIDLLKYANK